MDSDKVILHPTKVLITGTSSGIGYGLATEYLKRGHVVYGISRKSNDDLSAYQNYHHLSMDLTKFKEVDQKLCEFLKDEDSIDIAILNAGFLSEIKDLKNTDIDTLQYSMDLNVWANKVIIDTLLDCVEEVTQIVAISSGAAASASRGWNAYAISKAALNMLVSLYAKEQPQTHFCALAPGIIDTSMQDYISSLENDERFPIIARLKSIKGTEEMPKPDEAAKTLIRAFDTLTHMKSGSFIDVSELIS